MTNYNTRTEPTRSARMAAIRAERAAAKARAEAYRTPCCNAPALNLSCTACNEDLW